MTDGFGANGDAQNVRRANEVTSCRFCSSYFSGLFIRRHFRRKCSRGSWRPPLARGGPRGGIRNRGVPRDFQRLTGSSSLCGLVSRVDESAGGAFLRPESASRDCCARNQLFVHLRASRLDWITSLPLQRPVSTAKPAAFATGVMTSSKNFARFGCPHFRKQKSCPFAPPSHGPFGRRLPGRRVARRSPSPGSRRGPRRSSLPANSFRRRAISGAHRGHPRLSALS